MNTSSKGMGAGFWKEHFSGWETSGLTQQGYCEREGISYRSFVYQHHRQAKGALRNNRGALNFVEATASSITNLSQGVGLQLLLPNGIRVGIGSQVSSGLLQTVLSIAGALSC